MPRNRRWSKDELTLALDLYFKIGASYKTHTDVIHLSGVLNQLFDSTGEPDAFRFRNPNGVAMKLGNFASLDGNYSGSGLSHRNKLEQVVWDEYSDKRNELELAVASIKSDISYNPVSEAKAVIGGQGFSSSSKTRKAIELAAMNKAKKHYRSLGWNVGDVSSNHPYDLRCIKPAEVELHVEVKGTTGDGSSVLLTPGEVKHNEQFPKADLFILHSLNVQEDGSGNVHVSGGTVIIYSPWNVHAGTLSPIGYEYFPS